MTIAHYWIVRNAQPDAETRLITLTLAQRADQVVHTESKDNDHTPNDVPRATPASPTPTVPEPVAELAPNDPSPTPTPAETTATSAPPAVAEQRPDPRPPATAPPATPMAVAQTNADSSSITVTQAEPSVAAEAAPASQAKPSPPLTIVESNMVIAKLATGEVPTVSVASLLPPLAKEAAPPVASAAAEQEMLRERTQQWLAQAADMAEPMTETQWQHNGQQYQARLQRLPATDDMAHERITIEVTTERDGRQLSTRMQMKKLAFSHYAQFVNRWDRNVQIHDDELDGRFHSNSRIQLATGRSVRPTFHGKVTTASHRVDVNGSGRRVRQDIFRGGLETGVNRIGIPASAAPRSQSAGIEPTQVFDDHTRIVFDADGSYWWQPLDESLPLQQVAIGNQPAYLVATGRSELHVSGIVRGKVTAYSPRKIVIEDDLLYAWRRNGRLTPTDMLGLISDGDVVIAGPRITGPGDLRIHAAVFAKRRFAVKRYRSRSSGLMSVFGSVSAGTVSATEPRYATRIEFDKRLEKTRPPGFPVTDHFELESWDGSWSSDVSETDLLPLASQ